MRSNHRPPFSDKGQKLYREWNSPPRDGRAAWLWLSMDMLESPAWRALPSNSYRVVERILVEFGRHGMRGNGDLVVTHNDFEAWGIRRQSLREAIAIAEALGFIEVVFRGTAARAEFRFPSRYRLTFRPHEILTDDGRSEPVQQTDEWTRIKSVQDAERIIAETREQLQDQRESERGQRISRLQMRGSRARAVA
jgi:hypothetical protein